ncbi:MAG: hypothetical protein A2461_08235 [Burkholderiales bacterium RIFOXYC2_FULL_59_8]|nr:MAG: hypothetical protein A2461_08235 [Burkholderiales bacterium RIFOXYC2_FULL_59_8]
MDRLDLGAQVVGHGGAVGLVLRVQVITKSGAFGVKHTGGVLGGHFLAQTLQHVDDAANGPGRRAARVARHSTQVRHGVKSAVQVTGSIDQQQGFGWGIVHAGILPAADRTAALSTIK